LFNHKVKLGVEEYLTESSLPYTILLLCRIYLYRSFTAKTPVLIPLLLTVGTIRPRCKVFLYLLDLAEIADSVLIKPEPHLLASYSLVGENISLAEVSDIVSEETGVPSTGVRANRERRRRRRNMLYGSVMKQSVSGQERHGCG